jgi:PST family polysaccharide transporter
VSGTTRRFATGAGWLYAHRWLERLLDFLAIVVLARLLAPGDFGLVAIAASITTIVEGLSAFDVDKALIRSRDDDPALYDTAWTLSALRGLLAALAMWAVAPWVADARMAAVLRTLALVPILNGLRNPRFVTFERDLVYSRLAVLTIAAKVVSVGAMLAVAMASRSYWALVLGQLAFALTGAVLSYLLLPYRPVVSLARVSTLASFSGWLTLTSVVTVLSMETDKLIVGWLVGVTDAGLYFMTQRVGVLPTQEMLSPLQRILFPAFSELGRDASRLRRVACESINVLATLSLPAGFGFALVAAEFVPIALGRQWSPIVPLLVVLTPYLGLRSTLSMTLPCVLALGRTRLLFWVSAAYALVHVPLFVAGTALFGLPGSIWSIVVAGILYSYLNAWLLRAVLGISLGEIVSQVRRPLAATALMVAAVAGLAAVTPLDALAGSAPGLSLAVKTVAGGAVFCGALYAIWRLEDRPAGIERRVAQLWSR